MGTRFVQKTIFFVGELWICNNQHLPPPTWSFATMMICPTNTWFFSISMILSQQHMIFSQPHDPFLPLCCLIYSVNSSTMMYGKILEKYRTDTLKICAKWAHNGPFELSTGPREHREWVRSLNLRQFEPLKTFPGLKNVKNVARNCDSSFFPYKTVVVVLPLLPLLLLLWQ